jgi:hypothetical protein
MKNYFAGPSASLRLGDGDLFQQSAVLSVQVVVRSGL